MESIRLSQLTRLFALVIVSLVLVSFANAQSSPDQIPSQGTSPNASSSGGGPLILSPTSLEFGDHEIGTITYSQVVTARNNGKLGLKLNVVISVGDVDFALEKPFPPDKLAPGADCLIYVKFAPIGVGLRNGELKVNFQAEDASTPATNQTVKLSGTGFVPKLRVSPEGLDFGPQVMGSTSPVRTVILTAGPEPVGGIVASTTGDFSVTPVVCEQLQPSSSCALSVTFAPKGRNEMRGSLTILNDKTPRKILPLTGTSMESCSSSPAFLSLPTISSLLPVLLIVMIYLVALVLVRWNMIARPSRNFLLAEIGAVRRRVEGLDPEPGLAQVLQLLEQAEQLVTNADSRRWWDYLFWSRGQELAAWNCVHEAEEQLVFFLPEEIVRAELERVEGDLREAGTTTALLLADRIKEALAGAPLLPLKDPVRAALNAVLQFLQPARENLASDVSNALKPDVTLTPEQWHSLGEKVLSFLAPKAAALRERINEALASPAPDEAKLRELLADAADVLQTNTDQLAAELQLAFESENASPPTPLTDDQWRAVIAKAQECLTPHASLVRQIQLALAEKPKMPIDRWRALHSEALGYLYNRSDNQFAELVSWQNKTVWLVGCSLLLIVSLAATLQHGILFLVGATGGLMSRLMRSLSRAEVPTDYGASWSTIFLSPLVGALAGWAGILLVIVGVEFNILGSALKFDWCNTFNPVMLGLAFLLGFSERLFDGILDQLNRKVGQVPPASSSLPPGSSPAALTIVTAAALPAGKVDQSYSVSLAASGGTPPYQWTLFNGTLPAGLKLDVNGQLAGKPTAKGTGKFTLRVSDAAAKTQTLEFTIVIA